LHPSFTIYPHAHRPGSQHLLKAHDLELIKRELGGWLPRPENYCRSFIRDIYQVRASLGYSVLSILGMILNSKLKNRSKASRVYEEALKLLKGDRNRIRIRSFKKHTESLGFNNHKVLEIQTRGNKITMVLESLQKNRQKD
jgi:hypothetical protein